MLDIPGVGLLLRVRVRTFDIATEICTESNIFVFGYVGNLRFLN
jgi:hypothetical protein